MISDVFFDLSDCTSIRYPSSATFSGIGAQRNIKEAPVGEHLSHLANYSSHFLMADVSLSPEELAGLATYVSTSRNQQVSTTFEVI
jgi:hypothetical protein